MADLTQGDIERVRYRLAEDAKEAYTSITPLLLGWLCDAAERGLTAMAWTVNGPDVEKPVGRCLVIDVSGWWEVAEWHSGNPGVWCFEQASQDDEYVTHFMVIKEPTDA